MRHTTEGSATPHWLRAGRRPSPLADGSPVPAAVRACCKSKLHCSYPPWHTVKQLNEQSEMYTQDNIFKCIQKWRVTHIWFNVQIFFFTYFYISGLFPKLGASLFCRTQSFLTYSVFKALSHSTLTLYQQQVCCMLCCMCWASLLWLNKWCASTVNNISRMLFILLSRAHLAKTHQDILQMWWPPFTR